MKAAERGKKKEKAGRNLWEKVLMVHLMYSGLKPRVVFFYALHEQTTCEHLDINRYEKRCLCVANLADKLLLV